jgi:hypothetical protein
MRKKHAAEKRTCWTLRSQALFREIPRLPTGAAFRGSDTLRETKSPSMDTTSRMKSLYTSAEKRESRNVPPCCAVSRLSATLSVNSTCSRRTIVSCSCASQLVASTAMTLRTALSLYKSVMLLPTKLDSTNVTVAPLLTHIADKPPAKPEIVIPANTTFVSVPCAAQVHTLRLGIAGMN